MKNNWEQVLEMEAYTGASDVWSFGVHMLEVTEPSSTFPIIMPYAQACDLSMNLQ